MPSDIAYYDSTQALALAVENIQPIVDDVILNKNPLLKRFLKDSPRTQKHLRFENNKFIIPITIGYPVNFRGVAAKGRVPGASASVEVRMTASLVKHMGTANIPWENKVLASDAYVTDLVEKATKDIVRGAKAITDYHLVGSAHNGKLAEVASIAATVITVKAHGVGASGQLGNKRIQRGQNIVVDTAANLAVAGNEAENCYTTVASKNPEANTFVTTDDISANGVEPGNLVVLGEVFESPTRVNDYGKVLTGLFKHLDDTDETYQGLDRGDYPEICGNKHDASGTLRPVTEDLAQAAFDAAMDYSDGESEVDLVVARPAMIRAYYAESSLNRRYDGAKARLGSGRAIHQVDVVGFEPLPVTTFTPGAIAFLSSKSFVFATGDKPFDFERLAGSVLRMVGANDDYDIYGLKSRLFAQLICRNPRTNTILMDLTE